MGCYQQNSIMRYFLFFIPAFLNYHIQAQTLTIKGERIDSIVIESTTGAYQFDEQATTKGTSEELVLAPNTLTDKYIIVAQRQIQFSKSNATSSNIKKIKNVTQHVGTTIGLDQMEQLIHSLQNSLAPNTSNLSITSTDMQLHVSKKKIMRVARKNDWAWQFRNKYSMKEDNELFFKTCQSLDTFDIFLVNKFDSILSLMVTDYTNYIAIKIFTSNNCYSFSGSYPDPFKQPWGNNLNKQHIWNDEVINLNINRMLELILPDGFYNKESISRQTLFDLYIEWYFKRNNMAG